MPSGGRERPALGQVVHRDIKGANLLVDLDFRVKLADFGCSKCSADTLSYTTVGSIPWMAPEARSVGSGEGGLGMRATGVEWAYRNLKRHTVPVFRG